MNKLLPNVYVVDSAGLWLTSDSSATGNFLDFDFQTVKFVSGTSGQLEITYEADTVNGVIFKIFNATGGTDFINFPRGHHVENRLFVKTCTAGSAWLYFF